MLTSGILGAIGAATLFSGSSFALAVKRDATPTSGTLSLTFSSYNGVATPTNIPSMSEANSKDTINVNIRSKLCFLSNVSLICITF